MSEITRKYFDKLHRLSMEQSEEYRYGYQYVMRRPYWENAFVTELEMGYKTLISVASQSKNHYALGQATAIRDLLHQKRRAVA